MSEGTSAESTTISQASAGGSSYADPLAAGEAIDEMLAASDPPKLHKKRKYPEPDLTKSIEILASMPQDFDPCAIIG